MVEHKSDIWTISLYDVCDPNKTVKKITGPNKTVKKITGTV